MTMESLISTTKRLARSGAALSYYVAGRHKRANLGQIVILMYHRVLADNDDYIPYIQPGMYVRESSFDMQLQFLAANYEIISFEKMLALIESRRVSRDRQYCVITFDDGWLDNYEFAFPILKQHSATATIFLTTSFIGTNRSFWHEKISRLFYLGRDRLHSGYRSCNSFHQPASDPQALLKRHFVSSEHLGAAGIDAAIEALKPFPVAQIEQALSQLAEDLNVSLDNQRTMLNWDEVAEMSRNSISFGSHTCEHSILTQVDVRKASWEIETSMRDLKSRNLNFVSVFCYPNGRYNNAVKSLVAGAGYSAAVTTRIGRETGGLQDPFTLPRIGIHDDIACTKHLFSFRLR